MVMASNALLLKVGDLLLDVDSRTICPSPEVRKLCVVLGYTFRSIPTFHHFKNISRLRSSLTDFEAFETLTQAFITTLLD